MLYSVQMITAIIQARLGSTRLPQKVLLPLGKKTVIESVIDRVRASKNINEIIVATTIQPEDQKIFNFCHDKNIKCFRGSLEDVLDRYYQAAKHFGVQHIARITSDCPLIDPNAIDEVAEKYLEGSFDYVSNNHPAATYPDGLDTEIFSFKALGKAWRDAKLKSEREHVTPYIWKKPDIFRLFTVKNPVDLSEYRLTIDEPRDYELLQVVVSQVKPLTTRNILKFLDNNSTIKEINAAIKRDEGYAKSLKEDNKND